MNLHSTMLTAMGWCAIATLVLGVRDTLSDRQIAMVAIGALFLIAAGVWRRP